MSRTLRRMIGASVLIVALTCVALSTAAIETVGTVADIIGKGVFVKSSDLRPASAGSPTTFLILGSDQRDKGAIDYTNFGRTFAEAVWGWRADKHALAQRVVIDNREMVNRYVADRKSVVLLAAHFCNWEWLVLAACAELGIPISPLYKPLRVASVDDYVHDARARFGGRPIALDNLLYELTFRAGEPRAFAILADQTPTRDAPKHWRRFLNQDTAFYAGLGMIARYLDAPVIFVAMRRVSRGVYSAHLHLIVEPPYADDPEARIVDGYATLLEAEIDRSPEDFLWVHRKWKYPKPGSESAPSP